MKKVITFYILFAILTKFNVSFGQNKDELEIRKLETLWTKLLDNADTTALLKIWSKDYVVNNPNGKIATANDIIGFIRNGQKFPSVERIIERITFTNNLAIVMGKEIAQTEINAQNSGQTTTRRFTNIWMKSNNVWLLTARQATTFSSK